jgi:hypothetical protein
VEGGLDLAHPLVVAGEPRRRRVGQKSAVRENPSWVTSSRSRGIGAGARHRRRARGTAEVRLRE